MFYKYSKFPQERHLPFLSQVAQFSILLQLFYLHIRLPFETVKINPSLHFEQDLSSLQVSQFFIEQSF